jgi:hypothetical protein
MVAAMSETVATPGRSLRAVPIDGMRGSYLEGLTGDTTLGADESRSPILPHFLAWAERQAEPVCGGERMRLFFEVWRLCLEAHGLPPDDVAPNEEMIRRAVAIPAARPRPEGL